MEDKTLSLSLPCQLRLGILDQFLDSPCISFAVPMAGDRIRAARGLDQNLGPDQSGLDMHRGHLTDAHAHLIQAKPRSLAPAHRFVAHLDISREKQIASRPPARSKNFCWHWR